jgi:hypothetical protein
MHLTKQQRNTVITVAVLVSIALIGYISTEIPRAFEAPIGTWSAIRLILSVAAQIAVIVTTVRVTTRR